MQRKIILSVLVVGFVWFFPTHFTTSPGTADSSVSYPQIAPIAQASAPSNPIHLTIPNAHVDTNIIDLGVTSKGNLDVPGNYTEVGWYKYGARPGEIGSAVLDGHVDNGGSIPGPFKHLRDLKAGDDIYVSMSDGKVLHYKVTVSQVYPLSQFPGEMVFNQTGDRYLKIITCHGKFVPKLGTYDQRLIVTAVLDL
jgi:LPXTG-site transpeptidase (sortase) family protein